MAKAPASDSIMTPDKMKPMLASSKLEPVHAAIGLTADGDAVLLLHKKAKPKKVLSMMRADAGKAKLQLNSSTLRFGRAEVDTDYDSSMVRFFVNKETPGNMRIKLVELIKRASYQKVEINVDPSLENEPEDDEGAPEAAAPAEAPAPAAVPEAPPPPPAAPPPFDAARFTGALAALIGRIGKAGDGQKPELMRLAGVANGAIKARNADAAETAITALRVALDAPAAPPAPPPAAPPVVQPEHDLEALKHELAGLIGQIPAAAGTDATRRGVLAKLAGEANAKIKGNDAAAAAIAVTALREAIQGAAPVTASPAPEAPPPAVDAHLTERLMHLRDEAGRLKLGPEFTRGLAEAVQAVRAGSADAAAMVEDLESELATLASARRREEASAMIRQAADGKRGGVVAFAKLRLALNQAVSSYRAARANLEAAWTALLATEDFAADPRSAEPETQQLVANVADRIPDIAGLSETVGDALDAMNNATDPAEREKHGAEARKAIAAYRQELAGDEMLTFMEDTEAGKFGVFSLIDTALKNLEAAIGGGAAEAPASAETV